jgi:hypothetical protein
VEFLLFLKLWSDLKINKADPRLWGINAKCGNTPFESSVVVILQTSQFDWGYINKACYGPNSRKLGGVLCFSLFDIGSHYVAQASLKITILPP